MDQPRFNTIAILDAVPDGELNTSRILEEELQDLRYRHEHLNVRYYRVQHLADLHSCIADLRQALKSHGLVPMLHLEGHGLSDGSGFALADGSACPWLTLKENVTPLNIDLHLALFIVLATCHGGTFARAIRLSDRAPVWGLLGPARTEAAGHLQDMFTSFYRTFFDTNSGSKALEMLNVKAKGSTFIITTAESYFESVWLRYKEQYCKGTGLTKWARELRKKVRLINPSKSISLGRIKRVFSHGDQRFFDKFRDTYFMYDLYPENRTRFPVTYRSLEGRR